MRLLPRNHPPEIKKTHKDKLSALTMSGDCGILVISRDRRLGAWASGHFGTRCYTVNRPDSFRVNMKLDFVIIGCDYKCDINYCAKALCLAKLRSDLSPMIARPLVFRESIPSAPGYFLFCPDDGTSSSFVPVKRMLHSMMLGQERRAVERSICQYRRGINILKLQQCIIEQMGRIRRIGDLATDQNTSLLAISRAFSGLCGLTLKGFINKIRLCQCLWQLIQTSRPVKRIALDAGYKPSSFSLRFYRNYGVWPSDIRSMKEMAALEISEYPQQKVPIIMLK